MDNKVINYTCLACLAAYFIVCTGFIIPFGDPEKYGWPPERLIVAFSLLICAYFITRLILARISEAVLEAEKLSHEKEQLSLELARDAFTRLFNHISFYECLDHYIIEAQNESLVFSILIMDVDNFKSINDCFGHDIGDVVLLKLVDIINCEKRDEDLAFRFGGEEFIILLKNRLASAEILAERIRKRFGAFEFHQMSSKSVTVSIGVCEYSDRYAGRAEFFSAADKALYHAKHGGKNRTVTVSGHFNKTIK